MPTSLRWTARGSGTANIHTLYTQTACQEPHRRSDSKQTSDEDAFFFTVCTCSCVVCSILRSLNERVCPVYLHYTNKTAPRCFWMDLSKLSRAQQAFCREIKKLFVDFEGRFQCGQSQSAAAVCTRVHYTAHTYFIWMWLPWNKGLMLYPKG